MSGYASCRFSGTRAEEWSSIHSLIIAQLDPLPLLYCGDDPLPDAVAADIALRKQLVGASRPGIGGVCQGSVAVS
jgi:hypothetical protein